LEKENTFLSELTRQFLKLPGVGNKSARRFAYHIMKMPKLQVENFSKAVLDTRNSIETCKICGSLTNYKTCDICRDTSRDVSFICVVAESKDIFHIEKSCQFNGVYHVLGGVISPLYGIGPNDIKIDSLEKRVFENKIREVMIATGTSVEGEATAVYISKILKTSSVKISRLAYGICVGSDLEFTDEITISHAISGRKEI
jgi:recombination protein RecR